MKENGFIERVFVYIWWLIFSFAWLLAIFNKKVFESNEQWLINYGKRHKEAKKRKSLNNS